MPEILRRSVLDSSNLPSTSRKGSRGWREVWIRLAAFLSLKAPETRRTYETVLREWCGFLGVGFGTEAAARKILNVDDLHASAYRTWLLKQPGQQPRLRKSQSTSKELSRSRAGKTKNIGLDASQSNATVAKKFHVMRRLYRVLSTCNLYSGANPFDSDLTPPPPAKSGQKRPTEMVDFKVVKNIIGQCEEGTPKGLRDKAVLSILFGGGLRRSEVCNIRLGDVRKSQGGTIFLRLRSTKAKRDADQALPKWAATAVVKVLEARLKQGALPGDYLFVSYRGKAGSFPTPHPLSTDGLYKLFKFYCRKAGAGEFVSPHSARATAITKLLTDGVSHREVQEFSRHASVQMVELYDKRRMGVDENPAKDLDY